MLPCSHVTSGLLAEQKNKHTRVEVLRVNLL